jgi:L-amino acid N-acyltransferase
MITIRRAKREDLPQILDIYNEVILHTTAVYNYKPHDLQMRQEWFEARQRENHPVFVAEEAEKILGFSSYGPFRAWRAYKYTVENSVYVEAGHRGRGISKHLLEPLIEEAKQQDLHAIIAGIDATNTASIRLHESFGFREVAHFREVGYKFGRWLDLKFLELLLATPANPDES